MNFEITQKSQKFFLLIDDVKQLTKMRLALSVVFSSLAGYLLASDNIQIQNLFLSVAKSVQISGHTITYLKTDDHICSYESSTNEFMIVAKSKNHDHKKTWVHDQTVHFPFFHPEKCILRMNSPTYSVLSESNSTNSMDEDF